MWKWNPKKYVCYRKIIIESKKAIKQGRNHITVGSGPYIHLSNHTHTPQSLNVASNTIC